jgi:hypothetical protein
MNPSERAVLKIIRLLALETSSLTHRVSALRARWPVVHVEAYVSGYESLIRKGLLFVSPDGQLFGITNSGLKVMSALS